MTLNLHSELRLIEWQRSEPLAHNEMQADAEINLPEEAVFHCLIRETFARCLDHLPAQYRFALIQCVVEGESAATVGQALNVSANAVHLLAYRAQKMMQAHLEKESVDADILAMLPN